MNAERSCVAASYAFTPRQGFSASLEELSMAHQVTDAMKPSAFNSRRLSVCRRLEFCTWITSKYHNHRSLRNKAKECLVKYATDSGSTGVSR